MLSGFVLNWRRWTILSYLNLAYFRNLNTNTFAGNKNSYKHMTRNTYGSEEEEG